MSESQLPSGIFNTEKKDYAKPSLFFGEPSALMDTVHVHYPIFKDIFQNIRTLEWDEFEFDFTPCVIEFESRPKEDYELAINNLAWQWEADSIASRLLTAIYGAVCSNSEFWRAVVRITDNENTHAATYSEIVKNSFRDPQKVLDDIMARRDTFARLERIGQVLEEARVAAGQYWLGQIPYSQELYNKIFMAVVAFYILERLQFMVSFSQTFAMAENEKFQPIANAVQKIAQDEFEVHCQFGQEILKIELATERGQLAYQQCRQQIADVLNEVVEAEGVFLRQTNIKSTTFVGLTMEMFEDWRFFNGTAVATFLELRDAVNFPLVDQNPLVFMADWIDMGKSQHSPMEMRNSQYRVNNVRRDDEHKQFDVDF